MSNLAKHNLGNLGDKLRERVKELMGELIPDEKWDELIEEEIKSFFDDKAPLAVHHLHSYTGYDRKEMVDLESFVTPFRALVYRELCKATKERLEEVVPEKLKDPEGVEKFIEKFVAENAQELFTKMLTDTFKESLAASLGIVNSIHVNQVNVNNLEHKPVY